MCIISWKPIEAEGWKSPCPCKQVQFHQKHAGLHLSTAALALVRMAPQSDNKGHSSNKSGTFQNQTKQHTMEEILNNHLVCINLVNNGINYLSIHVGFLPSKVSHELQFKTNIWNLQVSSESAELEALPDMLHIITFYWICANIIILLSVSFVVLILQWQTGMLLGPALTAYMISYVCIKRIQMSLGCRFGCCCRGRSRRLTIGKNNYAMRIKWCDGWYSPSTS